MNGTLANYAIVLGRLYNQGYTFSVYGIPPTGKQDNIYHYPYYGTRKQRSKIVRLFNAKIRQLCKKKGYHFIDIYPNAVGPNGLMAPKMAADEVHLSSRIVPFVRSELDSHYSNLAGRQNANNFNIL